MFLRRNSSDNRARTELLNSVRSRKWLVVATLGAIVASAFATAGYAWLVGPLVRSLEANSGGEIPVGALRLPSLGLMQIVWMLVGLGALRSLSETLRAHLAARLQL